MLTHHQMLTCYQPSLTSTGITMATSDLLTQIFLEQKSVDLLRSLRFGGVGFCIMAPSRFAWYRILEHQIPSHNFKQVGKKVIVDQACFAPCFVLVMIVTVSFANQMSTHEVINKVQSTYKDILCNNWKVWPLAQMFNFYLVPPHLRMSFAQFVGLAWNMYLSWKTNNNV